MRQCKMRETKGVEKVICNKCGKEIVEADVLDVEKRWGYFSNKDNEVHRFDLCEACYDEFISTFEIPIEIENR